MFIRCVAYVNYPVHLNLFSTHCYGGSLLDKLAFWRSPPLNCFYLLKPWHNCIAVHMDLVEINEWINESMKAMILNCKTHLYDSTFVRVYKVMRRNLQPTKPETPGQTPFLNDKCTGFFYVHYTTHGTYSFTSHPKDEAIMVKCLAQEHKRRDRPGQDSNPHSGWVGCTRPLGHDTPVHWSRGTVEPTVHAIMMETDRNEPILAEILADSGSESDDNIGSSIRHFVTLDTHLPVYNLWHLLLLRYLVLWHGGGRCLRMLWQHSLHLDRIKIKNILHQLCTNNLTRAAFEAVTSRLMFRCSTNCTI